MTEHEAVFSWLDGTPVRGAGRGVFTLRHVPWRRDDADLSYRFILVIAFRQLDADQ